MSDVCSLFPPASRPPHLLHPLSPLQPQQPSNCRSITRKYELSRVAIHIVVHGLGAKGVGPHHEQMLLKVEQNNGELAVEDLRERGSVPKVGGDEGVAVGGAGGIIARQFPVVVNLPIVNRNYVGLNEGLGGHFPGHVEQVVDEGYVSAEGHPGGKVRASPGLDGVRKRDHGVVFWHCEGVED